MFTQKLSSQSLFFLVCFTLFFLGFSLLVGAVDLAKIKFTSDVILNLEGIASGNLFVASGSECDALDFSGKNMTVTSIPTGANFALKTTKHANALKIIPTSEKVNFSFTSDDLTAGEIVRWTISGSDAVTKADIIWGVPNANASYIVIVNGSIYNSFVANADGEISFSYANLEVPQTFTLQPAGGGGVIYPSSSSLSAAKPAIFITNGIIDLASFPSDITQIAISRTSDFTDIPWRDFDIEKFKTINQHPETLYLKFRTNQGAISDVIVHASQTLSQTLNDGDIVKSSSSPDIYVIKYKNNKQYKRLLLSPTIFNSYLHLKWDNIKTVSKQQLDQYQTSDLAKETLDTIIYRLFPDNDTGKRKPLNPSTSYDPDSIYEINKPERDSYELED